MPDEDVGQWHPVLQHVDHVVLAESDLRSMSEVATTRLDEVRGHTEEVQLLVPEHTPGEDAELVHDGVDDKEVVVDATVSDLRLSLSA